MKYYYENLLANQNVTAKTNVAWVADITTLKLVRDKKAYVFLCIDIHTNYIVSAIISSSVITSQKIVRSLEKGIKQRITLLGKNKLIIHTDRGIQFSSKTYNTFVTRDNVYLCPSMARENTPTDNSVAERFMRTFKEHKIYETTIEEKLSNNILIEPNFRSYRSVFNEYIRSLNSKPNKKKKCLTSPQRHDRDVSTASRLMTNPKYTQAKSVHSGKDFRINEVEKFKAENTKVIGILADIAARKAELVEKTPFDKNVSFDKNSKGLILKIGNRKSNQYFRIY